MTESKENKRFKVPPTKLSDFERLHIIEGFNEDVRNDGRSNKQFRPICLETAVRPQLEGSARISADHVEIFVGVRAELDTIVDPDAYFATEMPRIRMDFNVEFSPNGDPRFLGREPQDLAEQVRCALAAAYSNDQALPTLKNLQVAKRLAWKIYVDVEVNEYDGNVIDYAGIAVKAALMDFRIPDLRRNQSAVLDSTGAEIEGVDLPPVLEFIELDTSRCPLFITVNIVNENFAVDVTESEFQCVTSSTCLAMIINDANGKLITNPDEQLITYASTIRRGTAELSTLQELYRVAADALRDLDERLREAMSQQTARNIFP
ncbi:3 exoribonuclease family, domain 1 containing protein [Aphelenchoides fujianensis]|nr:3 exoribonuclease family, domain 1 containing protein [Aphelenchoides fujianensis]